MKMICRCPSIKTGLEPRYPDLLLAWAYEYLDRPKMGWGTPTTAKDFLSRAVMELHWVYSAAMGPIDCDQWFGIWAENYSKTHKVYVECDRVEDGIAYILRDFYKLKRKEAPMTM
jgi:hypothetical protein